MSEYEEKLDVSILYKIAMWIIDSAIKSSALTRIVVFSSLLILHLVLVYFFGSFNYLASFGGLMTVIGFIFIFGYSFPEHEPVMPSNPVSESRATYTVDVGDTFSETVPREIAEEINKDYKKKVTEHHKYLDAKRRHLFQSFYFTVSGTLLWAYAGYLDLVFCK
ncbi:hypothetical protein [Microbulbifer magnicolonia]|uniref:hypothetical protein n=1 Tax=Microbulbifer magnicolonia TaxID=3109744 RepID=UPI002B41667A|nr:hypothetical protein [Microbulbifer sp. GG15]